MCYKTTMIVSLRAHQLVLNYTKYPIVCLFIWSDLHKAVLSLHFLAQKACSVTTSSGELLSLISYTWTTAYI